MTTTKDGIMTALTSQPKYVYVIGILAIGVNVAILPLHTDTTATVYGVVCLAGFSVLYALRRRLRQQTVRQHS